MTYPSFKGVGFHIYFGKSHFSEFFFLQGLGVTRFSCYNGSFNFLTLPLSLSSSIHCRFLPAQLVHNGVPAEVKSTVRLNNSASFKLVSVKIIVFFPFLLFRPPHPNLCLKRDARFKIFPPHPPSPIQLGCLSPDMLASFPVFVHLFFFCFVFQALRKRRKGNT
eukprot:gene6264-4513_t